MPCAHLSAERNLSGAHQQNPYEKAGSTYGTSTKIGEG